MCGIAGLWSPKGLSEDELRRSVGAMTDVIAHRGPDGGGTWVDPGAGIGLGHRRLAVIELSDAGAQPMVSNSGRYAITFNGEIYNYPDLKTRLSREQPDLAWRGQSDTEVLLEAIAAWGLETALTQADGMFALAIWDRETRSLRLARDRFGEKPLYYSLAAGRLAFGSELRCIGSQQKLSASDISPDALEQLFQLSYIPAPHSIFSQVKKLPPASWVSISAEDIRSGELPPPRPYWSPVDAARNAAAIPFEGDDDAVVDRLQVLLEQAIASRLVSDVPVGAMLSGGVDSASIVAMAERVCGRSLHTFTVAMEGAYDESGVAAEVARTLGVRHEILPVGDREALDVVPHLADIYDEPFADSSQIPTFLVARALRSRVTVALSGDGGDELFGGYNRYRMGPQAWSRLSRAPVGLRQPIGKFLTSPQGRRLAALAAGGAGLTGEAAGRVSKAFNLVGARDEDEIYRRVIRNWPWGQSPQARSGDLLDGLLPDEAHAPGSDMVRRMMLNDAVGYMPGDILTKVDRASMAVALECRPPFLTQSLFEFSCSLPPARLIGAEGGKRPLRALVARHLPAELMNRPKRGFAAPIATWLRGPLKSWADDLLSTSSLTASGFYQTGLVEGLWSRHRQGTADNASMLWPVLMFESWRRRHLP